MPSAKTRTTYEYAVAVEPIHERRRDTHKRQARQNVASRARQTLDCLARLVLEQRVHVVWVEEANIVPRLDENAAIYREHLRRRP